MKHAHPPSNEYTEEFELGRQRVLDHLQNAAWIIGDLTVIVEFQHREKLTEIAGELNTLSRQLGEIGAK